MANGALLPKVSKPLSLWKWIYFKWPWRDIESGIGRGHSKPTRYLCPCHYRAQPEGKEMKRDMDLVRDILLFIESCEGEIDLGEMDTEHSINTIELHVELMCDAGLVEAVISPGVDGPGHYISMCMVTRLTWAGYEFLEASRKESRWEDVKKKCMDLTGGLSFSILKDLLLRAVP